MESNREERAKEINNVDNGYTLLKINTSNSKRM